MQYLKVDAKQQGATLKAAQMTGPPSWPGARICRLLPAVLLAVFALTATNPAHSQVQKDREFRECPESPVMVGIPLGKFLMGSPKNEPGRFDSEGPQHVVSIKAFALGKYDITTAQFIDFLKSTGHRTMPATGSSATHGVLPVAVWNCNRQTGRLSASDGLTQRPMSHGSMPRCIRSVRPSGRAPGRIVSRAKRSGNLPLARGPKQPGGGVRRSDAIEQIATAAAAHGTIDCSPPSKASPRTRLVSTAC
jgi:formylglycine-generating enzyme required for sulfatase activity